MLVLWLLRRGMSHTGRNKDASSGQPADFGELEKKRYRGIVSPGNEETSSAQQPAAFGVGKPGSAPREARAHFKAAGNQTSGMNIGNLCEICIMNGFMVLHAPSHIQWPQTEEGV